MYTGRNVEIDSASSKSMSSSSSQSSIDQDDVNRRVVAPNWSRYHDLLRSRGFRLDTYRDVKEFYESSAWFGSLSQATSNDSLCEYSRVCRDYDANALCKDAGLPDNLFRGYRTCDRKRIVVKCVHLYSREYDIVRYFSSPPPKDDPMNHCIPVLDLLEIPQDDMALIVMEEWTSQLMAGPLPSFSSFLNLIRQCIEHVAFMHKHHTVHLDISIHNFLTHHESHCACIDFELSQRFHGTSSARIPASKRGTEIPPEVESNQYVDPYKVDVWAMGVLILRACKLTGFCTPQLLNMAHSMLDNDPERRPSSDAVLRIFQNMFIQNGTF